VSDLRTRAAPLAPLATTVAGAAALAYLAAVDPGQPGHYPLCPFRATTGLACPGCGTLRCLHALLHGHFAAAVGFNVLTVAAVPFVMWNYAAVIAPVFGRNRPRPPVVPAWVSRVIVVVMFVFWVLRNIPVAPFTALAP
jgi:hypothetical protein